MDASKKKAYLKSRMREAAQKREKRIDSPLVKYDDMGQANCRVCNVAIKSEALWPAHLGSRLHKEAAAKLKAQANNTAAKEKAQANNTAAKEFNSSQSDALVATKLKEPAATLRTDSELNAPAAITAKSRTSSSLPDDFWDQPQAKRPSAGVSRQQLPSEEKTVEGGSDEVIIANDAQPKEFSEPLELSNTHEYQVPNPSQHDGLPIKGGQNSLPEGFFDNVDADYRARGLEPPKFNIQDEWKDFEKSIRENLEEVDLRMEEEEFDAAEDREQLESLEQRELLDRVEKLKRREYERAETTEITEVIAKLASRKPFKNVNLSVDEDSGSDSDSDDDNALLDWRAKHL